MSLEYWFMFPIGIIVATIAMSTLVGGATLFSPLFILVLGLQPHVAIAVALMIQFFGFGTGLMRYIKNKLIDYEIGFSLLFLTIPYTILGTYLSTIINPYFLRSLLGIIIIFIGYNLLQYNKLPIKRKYEKIQFISMKFYKRDAKKINLDGKEMRKNIMHASLGALFLGMTSAGLGEILGFNWIKKTDAQIKTIVATTVFVISITTIVASATNIYNLFTTNIEGLLLGLDILIFAIPGVVIGAVIGTRIIQYINQDMLQKFISIALIFTGFICFLPF